MPVFNGERFVEQAIDSIRNQTLTDWEFVIVDDGSTDGTPEILQQYRHEDSRIRLICNKHAGIVRALNDGLKAAEAEIIARIDADDIALPHRLQTQWEYLHRNPQCVCVGSSILVVDSDGRTLSSRLVPTEHDPIINAFLTKRIGIWHPTTMFRRQAVLDVGGYDPSAQWAEGLDLWLRLDESRGLRNLAEPLLRYRQHGANVSLTRRSQQGAVARRIVVRHCRRRDLPLPRSWHKSFSDRLRQRVWICMEKDRPLSGVPWAIASICANPFTAMSYRALLLVVREWCRLMGRRARLSRYSRRPPDGK